MAGKPVIGVLGPGEGAREEDQKTAFTVGRLIAKEGWILLTGGRNKGVMHFASKGARTEGGITLGILPGGNKEEISEFVDIPVVTGMGSARNNINVLSSEAVVGIGIGLGTASEIALALKAGKPAILLNQSGSAARFFQMIGQKGPWIVKSTEEAIALIKAHLKG